RVIPGDADRLRDQVFGNLLGNAFKFTPAGGRITVRGLADGDWAVIEVEDTGAGIPAAQLPHIFDKFFQVGEQARSQGTGLGLTIAHEVVGGHACFRIRLPAMRALAERALRAHQPRRDSGPVTGRA
ncbi:MAG: ATP-binding protein, partial [Gemmatimonadetes bacterium]|nr:ATP-binding protein [Gemmatimonadota bacterium]